MIFPVLNVAMSRHMLAEPPKNAYRLTIIAQHTVTIYSFLLLCQYGGDPPLVLTIFHSHLLMLMMKISVLFTGLLVVFIVTRRQPKAESPITKKPITIMRVARNLYSHYGTTVILWYLLPSANSGINPLLHNILLILWFIAIAPRFGSIYDIEGVSTSQVALPLAVLSILSDGLLLWLRRIILKEH